MGRLTVLALRFVLAAALAGSLFVQARDLQAELNEVI